MPSAQEALLAQGKSGCVAIPYLTITEVIPDFPPEPQSEQEVFISYACGGDRAKIADQLDQAFLDRGIAIVRDKRDLEYRGLIKGFMQRIGWGKCVIVVISKRYLESENCMFEFVQIAKNGEFYDRIFPIILDDANIFNPLERVEYVAHWEQKVGKLDEAMKRVSLTNLQGFWQDIDLYAEIRRNLPLLTDILRDMNTLTAKIHTDFGFGQLCDAVEQKIAEGSG